MNEITNLEELFYHELQVLWSAESMLTDMMPLLIEKATDPGLKKALSAHLAETREHKVVLEFICKELRIDVEGDFNPGIKGIIEEANMVLSKRTTPEGLDAAIIAGSQKVEHYEISGYGSAAYYAEMLGYHGFAKRLRLTLEEEQQADTKLNFIAKTLVNSKAMPKDMVA
ncbi:MAG: YciE/YciF ferroxidase family protein [Agriterribacter sp.]